MKTKNWQQELQSFNSRLQAIGVIPSIAISAPKGLGLLAHADFAATEGVYEPANFLMINLCTAHVGRMKRSGEGPSLEGVIRPGTTFIALPNTAAHGYWSRTQQLGIAINLDSLTEPYSERFTSDTLLPAASQLHNDPLLTSVMTAMLRDAEVNGVSQAFFEQGIYLLLNHLAEPCQPNLKKNLTYPLKGPRLQQVLDLIESRLSDDISVSELAELARQDVRSFTRSFSAATGFAPYAYFTYRRMEFAKGLLSHSPFSITDIAQTVGYANPSKFSAAFRRTYNLTPSQWRKDQRG
ncbi:helix-turn-helix domain-containing protein [Paraglaciecola marina]|uniref:helix-turn-helix domain-containing protein n=1 Tax=Paraglaciecola marina TaxID=2500157 RepID=UPI00105C7219|nr:AraC family transcriptional regulator [Paraglaciecola marina]